MAEVHIARVPSGMLTRIDGSKVRYQRLFAFLAIFSFLCFISLTRDMDGQTTQASIRGNDHDKNPKRSFPLHANWLPTT